MAISRYVRELRTMIGQRLILLPGVTVLIWNEQGQVLLVRSIHTGLWQTLGGAVDPGESPQAAAVREAFEETGVRIRVDGLRAAVGGPEYRFSYPNGDEVAYVNSVFDAHILSGTPHPDGDGEEVTESRWFGPAELASLEIEVLSRALLRDVGLLEA